MDKKGRIQIMVIILMFFIYCATAIFQNVLIMESLNYICGFVLGACFFIFGIYQNRAYGRKKLSRYFIIISILLIGLNLIR
jgi:hypothetical protein